MKSAPFKWDYRNDKLTLNTNLDEEQRENINILILISYMLLNVINDI